MKELLAADGSIYVHVDYRLVHYIFLLLVEIFGTEWFRNNIVWSYGGRGAKAISSQFPRNHDTLMVFAKEGSTYNRVYKNIEYNINNLPSHINLDIHGIPFKTSPRGDYTDESIRKLEKEGRILRNSKGNIRIKYPLEKKNSKVIEKKLVGDVWDDIPDMMHSPKQERLNYQTQKPEALIRRIIESATNKGDLVADFFCGSGTTMAVAEKTGRRWIGCDIGRWAIHVSRKRLLEIPKCKPFQILNLGKYERKHWQGSTFDQSTESSLSGKVYLEYISFILKLYRAQPLEGMRSIHGRKGNSVIHVGSVDIPVTIDEIDQAIVDSKYYNQENLHILGWEWEMGSNELTVKQAKTAGLKVKLLQIPREVMEVEKPDPSIRFVELAYLKTKLIRHRKRTVQIELQDFVIPNVEDSVSKLINKWSDYIDYWAVDWDFQNDSFNQGCVSYRTIHDRSLSLVSEKHLYQSPGSYKVIVKVIDIFGNDTSKIISLNLR